MPKFSALKLTVLWAGLTMCAGCQALFTDQDTSPNSTQTIIPESGFPATDCVIHEAQVLPADFSVTTHFENGQLTMNSGTTNILEASNWPMIQATTAQSAITVQSQQNGADLHVTLQNPTAAPLPLGDIWVAGIDMADTITSYDSRQTWAPFTVDRSNFNSSGYYWGPGWYYPNDVYSPVWVIKDSRYIFGISVLYPLLQYKHSLYILPFGYIAPDDHARWGFIIHLEGTLPAGEERQYTVNLRVLPSSEHEMKVLIPYRNYFRSLYGGVQYTRDPRPVAGIGISQPEPQSPSNPYGFVNEALRPDTNGWGPWAQNFASYEALGFHRAMIWTPTGLYYNHFGDNYPNQFMTEMRHVPAMNNSLQMLRAISTSSFAMGYWWGHAGGVPDDDWNRVGFETINPYNPAHVARAFEELDMAVSLGAKAIGLDAVVAMPGWDQYLWMQMLKSHAPGVNFIAEASPSDFVHTLVPSFIIYQPTYNEPLLADFLLPGHEIWAGIRFDLLIPGAWTSLENRPLRQAMIARDASLGYVPLQWMDDPLAQPNLADASWLRTIPQELRPCAP